MGLFWKLLILIVVVIAVLVQLEVPHNKWVYSKSITLKSSREDAWAFITSVDYVNKWFPYAHRFKEADGKPLNVGKKIYAIYNIPFYGEYSMIYEITEFKPEKLLVIEGENLLNPRIEFHVVKIKEKETKLTISVSFKRLSYFFQYLCAPVLYFVESQKLQHALLLLQGVYPY